jgi:PAS domain S-box-containing protein
VSEQADFGVGSSGASRRRRMQRTAIAVFTTLVAILMFLLTYAAGFIDLTVLVAGIGAAFALIALFVPLFYTGINLRFRDPALFLPQTMSATVVTSYVMAYAGAARPALTILYFASLVLCTLRFNWRSFTALAIFTQVCYAVVLYVAMHVDGPRFDRRAELLHWCFMLLATPWLGWLGSYLARLRQRVKAGEALYRAIWNTSVDAVVVFDERGDIRIANPAATRLFGHEAVTLRSMRVSQLAPERQRAALEHDLREYLLHGSMARDWSGFEDIVVAANGREIFVEAAVVELGGAGGRRDLFEEGGRRLALFARDVSQRHALEAIKDDFIASMSHELRTPLAAVIGAVEALQAGPGDAVPDSTRALLDMAAGGADRLNRLINTMLNLQRMESGRIEFAPTTMPASTLVDHAFTTEQPGVRLQGKFLAVARREDRIKVKADARWIHEVLVNLIDNAVKHSPAGATVVIGTETRERTVRFSVIDQGSGVSPEFAGRVFTRFERADNSNTRTLGGAGLGLSLCKAAVEGCGGTIGFFNNPGKGATFWFELPQASEYL